MAPSDEEETVAGQQRFFDQSQPQTLQIATFLLYLDAALLVLSFAVFSPLGLLFVAAYAGGAFGMANGKKWGYLVSVAVAVLRLVYLVVRVSGSLDLLLRYQTVELMFSLALVALLLHPQSREYQRIWFS
jgi:hypothetical protein